MKASGITVGTVNIIVHCVCLGALLAVGELAKYCVKKFTILRLYFHREAPIMHETIVSRIGSIPSLRPIFRKFYPGITFIVLLTIAAIPSEFAADFGVSVSNRCKPAKILTQGLCASPVEPPSGRPMATTMYLLKYTSTWNDDDLVNNPIRQGFRHQIDGTEYFKPDSTRDKELPVVVEGCRVGERRLISGGRSTISFLYGGKLHGAGYMSIASITVDGEQVMSGDRGGAKYRAEKPIIFTYTDVLPIGNTGFKFTVYEYHDWKQIRSQLRIVSQSEPIHTFKPVSPMIAYNVSCNESGLVRSNVAFQVAVPRFDVFHYPIFKNYTDGNITVSAVPPLTSATLVRTILGGKFAYQAYCDGETFVYTQCGTYKWIWASPLITIITILIVTNVVLGIFIQYLGVKFNVPMSAEEWYEFYEEFKRKRESRRQSNASNDNHRSFQSSRAFAKRGALKSVYKLNHAKDGTLKSFDIVTPSTQVKSDDEISGEK